MQHEAKKEREVHQAEIYTEVTVKCLYLSMLSISFHLQQACSLLRHHPPVSINFGLGSGSGSGIGLPFQWAA